MLNCTTKPKVALPPTQAPLAPLLISMVANSLGFPVIGSIMKPPPVTLPGVDAVAV